MLLVAVPASVLATSAGLGVLDGVTVVQSLIGVVELKVLGLIACSWSASLRYASLALESCQAIVQVLQGLGVVAAVAIFEQVLPPVLPAATSLVKRPLMLVVQQVFVGGALVAIIIVPLVLLWLLSPSGLRSLAEGVVV